MNWLPKASKYENNPDEHKRRLSNACETSQMGAMGVDQYTRRPTVLEVRTRIQFSYVVQVSTGRDVRLERKMPKITQRTEAVFFSIALVCEA